LQKKVISLRMDSDTLIVRDFPVKESQYSKYYTKVLFICRPLILCVCHLFHFLLPEFFDVFLFIYLSTSCLIVLLSEQQLTY